MNVAELVLTIIFLLSSVVYYVITGKFVKITGIGYLLFGYTLLIFSCGLLYSFLKNIPLVLSKKISIFADIRKELKKNIFFIRKLIPLIIVISIYENLHDITPMLNKTYDWQLLRAEEFIFNGKILSVWMEGWISPFLTKYLFFSYSSFIIYPFLILGVFYYHNGVKQFNHFLLSFVLTVFIGLIMYVVIPVAGPIYTFPEIYSVSLGDDSLTEIIQNLVNGLRYPRDAFPSLHVAITFLYLLFAFKYYKNLFYLTLPMIISIWISTVYLRYHYLLDWIPSFFLVFFAFHLGKKILALEK